MTTVSQRVPLALALLLVAIASGCSDDRPVDVESASSEVNSSATKLDANAVVAVDDGAAYARKSAALDSRSVDILRIDHGSATSRKLATIAVRNPAWITETAADADHLYFVNEGKLLRVAKTGGEPEDLRAPCSARAIAPHDGGLLFSCAGKGLMKLTASGSSTIVDQAKVDEAAGVGTRTSLLGSRIEAAEITHVATDGAAVYLGILRLSGSARSVDGVVVTKVDGDRLTVVVKPRRDQSIVDLVAADGSLYLLDQISHDDYSERQLHRVTTAGVTAVAIPRPKDVAAGGRGLVVTTYADETGFEKLFILDSGAPRAIAKSHGDLSKPMLVNVAEKPIAYATSRGTLFRIGAGTEPVEVRSDR